MVVYEVYASFSSHFKDKKYVFVLNRTSFEQTFVIKFSLQINTQCRKQNINNVPCVFFRFDYSV